VNPEPLATSPCVPLPANTLTSPLLSAVDAPLPIHTASVEPRSLSPEDGSTPPLGKKTEELAALLSTTLPLAYTKFTRKP